MRDKVVEYEGDEAGDEDSGYGGDGGGHEGMMGRLEDSGL